jgi:hypothetical protein
VAWAGLTGYRSGGPSAALQALANAGSAMSTRESGEGPLATLQQWARVPDRLLGSQLIGDMGQNCGDLLVVEAEFAHRLNRGGDYVA